MSERDPYMDVERLTNERIAGRDMSSIREEFMVKGYSVTEVRTMMEMIDRAQMKVHTAEADRSKATFLIAGGFSVFLIGACVTVMTYSKALNAGGGSYVLMFGAILGGIGMLAQGLVVKSRSNG